MAKTGNLTAVRFPVFLIKIKGIGSDEFRKGFEFLTPIIKTCRLDM
jgi:hypothetical protein